MIKAPLLITAALFLGACSGTTNDSETSYSKSASDLGNKITAEKNLNDPAPARSGLIEELKLTLGSKNACITSSNEMNAAKITHRIETDLVGDQKRVVTPQERSEQAMAFKDSMKSVLGDKWATKVCEALFKTNVEEDDYVASEDSEDIRNRDAIGALTGSVAKLKLSESSKLKLEYSPSEGETAIIFSKEL